MLGLLVLLAWSPAMPLAAAGQPGLCCRSAACAVPGTWKQMFACDTDTWTSHMQRPPWEWYLTAKTTQGDVVPLQCEGGLKSFSPCGSQTDCPGGDCVLVKMSAKQYLDRRLSCCRHCSWDMRFPVGAPIQVTAGNITLEPQELAIIAKYLDCNTFKAEFEKYLGQKRVEDYLKGLAEEAKKKAEEEKKLSKEEREKRKKNREAAEKELKEKK